jgi:hypothetical protein
MTIPVQTAVSIVSCFANSSQHHIAAGLRILQEIGCSSLVSSQPILVLRIVHALAGHNVSEASSLALSLQPSPHNKVQCAETMCKTIVALCHTGDVIAASQLLRNMDSAFSQLSKSLTGLPPSLCASHPVSGVLSLTDDDTAFRYDSKILPKLPAITAPPLVDDAIISVVSLPFDW